MAVITIMKPQSTPEDTKVINQITDAHKPDVNTHVKDDLVGMAKDILGEAQKKNSGVPEGNPRKDISKGLAFIIHKIGCQILCHCSGWQDMNSVTQGVFNALVKYSWEDKVAIALSAFSINYGEFHLVWQLRASNGLANYVFHLKPLPDICERDTLIRSLLDLVIKVINTIIELNGFSCPGISREQPPLSEARNEFPAAAYWAVKGIVACSSESTGLLDLDPQYISSIGEARKKLKDVTQKLNEILEYLENKLNRCKEIKGEYDTNKEYLDLKELIEKGHTDNMKILIELISKADNPLFNFADGKGERVSLNVLKSKKVMLFISYWDISDEEIKEIERKIGESKGQYEIVWLPIEEELVKSNKTKKDTETDRKAKMMKWYSLHSTLTLQSHVIKYIKDDWHFEEEPLLVVFNEKGKLIRSDAYHMAIIWGSEAYPFDIQREKTLWQDSKWNLKFLIEGVVTDCEKPQLTEVGKLICLYGGDDLEWIKEFTSKQKEVVKGDGISLELIYIGSKHSEEISTDKLSECWNDKQKIWRFHARLKSIMHSIMNLDISTTITDKEKKLKQVMMLVGAHGSGQEWTIMGKFESENVKVVNGKIMKDSLDLIKINLTIQNFFPTLDGAIEKAEAARSDVPDKHCNHIIIASNSGIKRKRMVCVFCNGRLKKYTMYKCCPSNE